MAGECLATLVGDKTFDHVAEQLQGCSEEQLLQLLQSRLHVSPFVAYLMYRDLRAPRHSSLCVVAVGSLVSRVEYWLGTGFIFLFSPLVHCCVLHLQVLLPSLPASTFIGEGARMWLHKVAVSGSDVDKLLYVDKLVKEALAPIQDLVTAFAPHGWSVELTEHHLHLGQHLVS